jgi:O-antigen ligase
MKSPPRAPVPEADTTVLRVFAALFGLLLGIALLKFPNPGVMEKFVQGPENSYEWLLGSWPIAVGHGLLAIVAVIGLFAARWPPPAPRWLAFLPLAWLGWQLVAALHTQDASLTNPTLKHFLACVACFYLGFLVLSRAQHTSLFWGGLMAAFAIVIAVGFEQHFGGLEESRRYFYTYIYPELKVVPPEYLQKISSNRIFSTLFYPNALAGAVVLLLPPLLAVLLHARRLTIPSRCFLGVLLAGGAMGCLFWSGSKGGWLLAMLMGLIVLLRLPLAKRVKIALLASVLVFGLAGFFWKYADFFQRGATSVGARFDYWEAAAKTTAAHPFFGTGPGTFAIAYERIKRPESEMARLAHNDYLQQASDSGVPGWLAYTVFVFGTLAWTCLRKRIWEADWLSFAIWLGVLGWALQGFSEFGLYIPALAWPAFALLGWLLGTAGNQIDKSAHRR